MCRNVNPSKYLQLEVSNQNNIVLHHTRNMLLGKQLPAKRIIFSDSYGTNAKHKLAKSKLDSWGGIKSHCSLANSKKKLARYKNMLEMADAIAEIEMGDLKDKQEKQKNLLAELISLAPVALEKLTQKKPITKKYIAAILYVKYNHLVKVDKYPKPALM